MWYGGEVWVGESYGVTYREGGVLNGASDAPGLRIPLDLTWLWSPATKCVVEMRMWRTYVAFQ